MTQYKITTSGKSYKVTGPAGASDEQIMQAISEQMDPIDRSVARSKNDSFGNFLRNQAQQPVEGESDEDRTVRLGGRIPDTGPEVRTGSGMLRNAFQGLSAGTGDEIVAGLKSVTSDVPFDRALTEQRQLISQFRDEQPALAIGSEIAGAIPTAMVPFLNAPRAVQGAGLLGKTLAGVGVVAAQGAAFGFNAGEGGVENRLKNTLVPAGFGAIGGGAVPAVAAGGRKVFDRFAGTGRAAKQAGMSRPAFETLEEITQADRGGAQRLAGLGDDATLAEAGPSGTAALDALAQRPGPTQRIIADALDERVGQASEKTSQALDAAFGQPAGIRTVETGLRRGTQAARKDAYDIAYETPINYADDLGRQIEDIVKTRVPRRAIFTANSLMRAEGQASRQIKVKVNEDGSFTYETLPDVRQIDYITRALNDVADVASGQGKLGGTTNLGRVTSGLSRELRALTKEAVPEYAVALDTAAQPIAARNALQLGRTALSPRVARDELAEAVSGMGGAERSYVAQGIRSQIDETLANVKAVFSDPNLDAREAAKALKDLSSRAAREKVETVIGPERAVVLFQELDQAISAFQLKASTAQNSKTAVRQIFNERLDSTARSGVNPILPLNDPLRAGGNLIKALTGQTKASARRGGDKVAAELANALLRKGPAAARTAGQLQDARNVVIPQGDATQRLIQQLLRPNVGVSAPITQR